MNQKQASVLDLYSVKETAQKLNVSVQSIYNELNGGDLNSFMVGGRRIIAGEDLADFIQSRREAGRMQLPKMIAGNRGRRKVGKGGRPSKTKVGTDPTSRTQAADDRRGTI